MLRKLTADDLTFEMDWLPEPLRNLIFLRDTVVPFMEQHPEAVDLSDWGRGWEYAKEIPLNCGACCLMGWYTRLRRGMDYLDYEQLNKRRSISWNMSAEFGVSDHMNQVLAAATVATADLQMRARLVREEIRRQYAEYDELPVVA